ncbi:MAG: hypothetical protein AAF799_06425 [Myxococcota bacterium]
MSRLAPVTIPLALCLGFGCTLLTPYPGGEDPAEVLAGSGGGFEGGEGQEPLVDPAEDPSIGVIRNLTKVVAHPGSAFPIDLEFDAPGMNVVGGGISFPGSDEVQWTFIEGLDGETTGNIRFGFVVDQDICGQVPNLCHEIKTQQFAVARNTVGDVDGDGQTDGDFVVSRPVEVTVVLQCSTCESPSCSELLPEDECQSCAQPPVCDDYFARCLDPTTNPDVTDADVAFFEGIFGPSGALWTTPAGCVAGEQACEGAEADGTECRLGGGGEGDDGGSSSGGDESGGTGA